MSLAGVRVLDSLLSPILRAANWSVNFLRDAIGGSLLVRRENGFEDWFVTDSSGNFVTTNEPVGYSADAMAAFESARARLRFGPGCEADYLQLTTEGIDALHTDSIFSLNAAGHDASSPAGAANAFIRDYTDTAVSKDRGWDWLRHFEGWVSDTIDEIAATSVAGAMVQLALIAGLLAAVAGLFYWSSKILGRRLPAGIGILAGLSLLGDAPSCRVSSTPAATSSSRPSPRRDSRPVDGVEALNLISMVGAIGVLRRLRPGAAGHRRRVRSSSVATDDDEDVDNRPIPVGGHTLEWLTESPPPPLATSPAPTWSRARHPCSTKTSRIRTPTQKEASA